LTQPENGSFLQTEGVVMEGADGDIIHAEGVRFGFALSALQAQD
jgi:hypothetical protein